MGDVRLFLSDIHLSSTKDRLPANPYWWLDQDGVVRIAGFLNWLTGNATDAGVKEVILLGDVFDNWVIPHDQIPPDISDILAAAHNQPFVEALNALTQVQGMKVIYLPGNHDMHTTQVDLQATFPQLGWGGHAAFDSIYVSGRLRAEHGSAHAMFCAPDPLRRARLPLGYFLSRLAATAVRDHGSRIRHFWTVIDDILEAAGPHKLAACVFEAMVEEARLGANAEFTMPTALWGGDSVKMSAVAELYANLYGEWVERKGPGVAFKALVAEIGWLEDVADTLCKKNGPNTVIFGHSHGAEMDKDNWFVDDRIYANCGTWCDDDKKKTPTYVTVEKLTDPREQKVSIFSWDGSAPQLRESASISY
jgi:UDP-2,3-diacylglucosamine pyrophosphatase LpxH